jgi:hypothetical protein
MDLLQWTKYNTVDKADGGGEKPWFQSLHTQVALISFGALFHESLGKKLDNTEYDQLERKLRES